MTLCKLLSKLLKAIEIWSALLLNSALASCTERSEIIFDKTIVTIKNKTTNVDKIYAKNFDFNDLKESILDSCKISKVIIPKISLFYW